MNPWVEVHKMKWSFDGKVAKWTCEECGREVQIYPVFKVLVRGDRAAVHDGSIGGVQITGLKVEQKQ